MLNISNNIFPLFSNKVKLQKKNNLVAEKKLNTEKLKKGYF